MDHVRQRQPPAGWAARSARSHKNGGPEASSLHQIWHARASNPSFLPSPLARYENRAKKEPPQNEGGKNGKDLDYRCFGSLRAGSGNASRSQHLWCFMCKKAIRLSVRLWILPREAPFKLERRLGEQMLVVSIMRRMPPMPQNQPTDPSTVH